MIGIFLGQSLPSLSVFSPGTSSLPDTRRVAQFSFPKKHYSSNKKE